MLLEVVKHFHAKEHLAGRLAGTDTVKNFTESAGVEIGTKEDEQRADGVGDVGSQRPRERGVAKRARRGFLEDAVAGESAEGAVQGAFVNRELAGEVGGGLRAVLEQVSNAEACSDVEGLMQDDVTARLKELRGGIWHGGWAAHETASVTDTNAGSGEE